MKLKGSVRLFLRNECNKDLFRSWRIRFRKGRVKGRSEEFLRILPAIQCLVDLWEHSISILFTRPFAFFFVSVWLAVNSSLGSPIYTPSSWESWRKLVKPLKGKIALPYHYNIRSRLISASSFFQPRGHSPELVSSPSHTVQALSFIHGRGRLSTKHGAFCSLRHKVWRSECLVQCRKLSLKPWPNPFTPKSDQFQISPAPSPGIFHHTMQNVALH